VVFRINSSVEFDELEAQGDGSLDNQPFPMNMNYFARLARDVAPDNAFWRELTRKWVANLIYVSE
jgi:hypothetical protein